MVRAAALALAAVIALALAVALNGSLELTEPANAGRDARIQHFYVSSEFVPGRRAETLVIPHGWRRGGPLLLWLHARGSSEDSLLTPSFFAALRAVGAAAPAVLIPSDNRYSFWHDRHGRAWASYLMRTVLPAGLQLAGADRRRVAVGGISMGGFGAFNLARLHPGRFCAVGGHSAALFEPGQPRLARSFDGAADFTRNDLLALAARRPRAFAGARLWLDVGSSDPFARADRLFAARLRAGGLRLTLHLWPGRHAPGYWHAHLAAYLRFYADALAACGHAR